MCSFASYLIRVRLITGASPHFLAFSINGPRGRIWIREVVSQQVGQANVNGSKLAGYAFPMPPLAEQHRIVAEVERRLSIADEAEATIEAALARAERLRQAILKRAFEGRLVPQDPNDEPASVLLERIRKQRDEHAGAASAAQSAARPAPSQGEAGVTGSRHARVSTSQDVVGGPMSSDRTDAPGTIRVGMRVWVPCEVKLGAFSDERLVRVEREGGFWLGFVPDAVLREPIPRGHTAVQALIDQVERGRVRASSPVPT